MSQIPLGLELDVLRAVILELRPIRCLEPDTLVLLVHGDVLEQLRGPATRSST